jgi:dolichyl-phosphate-mannose--protein O-mannosyl transferase
MNEIPMPMLLISRNIFIYSSIPAIYFGIADCKCFWILLFSGFEGIVQGGAFEGHLCFAFKLRYKYSL